MITDSGVYLSNRMRRTRPSLRVVYLCAPLCSAPLSGAQARRHSTLSIPHSRSAGQAGIPIIVAMQRLHCPPCYVANRFGCGAPRCSAVLLLLLIQKASRGGYIHRSPQLMCQLATDATPLFVLLRGSPHCGRQPSVSRPVRAISRRDSQFSSAPRVVAAYSASTPARAPVAIHPEQRA